MTDEAVSRKAALAALDALYSNPTDYQSCIIGWAKDAIRELPAQEGEVERLRAALERIAQYGEDHVGYVNAKIDGMCISKFARAAIARATQAPGGE